jgi:hypothetical protein
MHNSLREVPREALVRELFERAASQGDAQKEAFETMLATARMAVSQFVDLAHIRGYRVDGSDRDEHGDVGFWVLRSSTGSGGKNDCYGGGYLTRDLNYGRGISHSYLHVVATERSELSVASSKSTHLSNLYDADLHNPDYALGAIFNIAALRASPELCAETSKEVVDDIQGTIRRLGSY